MDTTCAIRVALSPVRDPPDRARGRPAPRRGPPKRARAHTRVSRRRASRQPCAPPSPCSTERGGWETRRRGSSQQPSLPSVRKNSCRRGSCAEMNPDLTDPPQVVCSIFFHTCVRVLSSERTAFGGHRATCVSVVWVWKGGKRKTGAELQAQNDFIGWVDLLSRGENPVRGLVSNEMPPAWLSRAPRQSPSQPTSPTPKRRVHLFIMISHSHHAWTVPACQPSSTEKNDPEPTNAISINYLYPYSIIPGTRI